MSNADLAAKVRDKELSIDDLDSVVSTREDALSLLGSVILAGVPGLDAARVPAFESASPRAYFKHVAELLERGGADGPSVLVWEASRLFPGKAGSSSAASPTRPLGAVAKRALPVSIALTRAARDEEILGILQASQKVASSLGKRAALDLITREEPGVCLSFENASDDDADLILRELQAALPPALGAEIAREDYAFRDYFMDPIWAEGPDGQRFSLDHVRASTRLVDVAEAILANYDEAFWPTGKGEKALAVVDLRRQGQRGARRLFSGQTLHDAGVLPFDLLFVHPERRAGSVNPFLLTESLAMVKNQILEFARTRENFEVQANSADVPTEYLIRFRAPGFAPGSPPRQIEQHEVLLVLPPDFPVKAPEAYFQREVFHPNVDPKTGLVCLGVLAESYRPGLHFGALCQMLIDMASYRNYELREGYDLVAAAWAGSAEGQAAIASIGGRAWGEIEQRAGRKRAIRVERLSA